MSFDFQFSVEKYMFVKIIVNVIFSKNTTVLLSKSLYSPNLIVDQKYIFGANSAKLRLRLVIWTRTKEYKGYLKPLMLHVPP